MGCSGRILSSRSFFIQYVICYLVFTNTDCHGSFHSVHVQIKRRSGLILHVGD